jgi:hypothetical protein
MNNDLKMRILENLGKPIEIKPFDTEALRVSTNTIIEDSIAKVTITVSDVVITRKTTKLKRLFNKLRNRA